MADGSIHPGSSPLEDEADDAWAQEQLRELRELARIGMTIARALPAQAEACADDPVLMGQLALTHSRVSRAIGQTHALEARLRQALRDGRCAAELVRKTQAETARAIAVTQRKAALRRDADRAVESHHEVFEHEGSPLGVGDIIEHLAEDPDTFLDTPFSTLLTQVCDVLDLVPDWRIFRHEPWAIAEIRDRPPNSDYFEFYEDCLAEGTWPDDTPDLEVPPEAEDEAPEPPDASP